MNPNAKITIKKELDRLIIYRQSIDKMPIEIATQKKKKEVDARINELQALYDKPFQFNFSTKRITEKRFPNT